MSLIRTILRRSAPDPAEMGPLYAPVKSAMENVQAYARSHGGEITLVGVTDDGEVKVRMSGACKGCPMSSLTLKHGIEVQLKQLVPGVKKIVEV